MTNPKCCDVYVRMWCVIQRQISDEIDCISHKIFMATDTLTLHSSLTTAQRIISQVLARK